MLLDGPTPADIKEEENNRQQSLNRARAILGTFYLVLPFILIYLLFKIFPPNPWGDWYSQPIYFFGKVVVVWTTLEERLILLVVAAGALGSYIHSATSYADFRGNRQFGPSWLLWYLLRPFIGLSLALVVYFAIRGGLLSVVLSGGEANDASKINPFGIAAISGLTGMFSKQAADKLAEVFSTLFKSQGDTTRKDSLTPGPTPEIKLIDPKEGPAAGGTKVTITGTGFAADSKVTFGNNAATNVTFIGDTTLTADTPPGTGAVDVIVTNSDGLKATAIQAYAYLPDGDGGGNGDGGAGNGGAGGDGGTVEAADALAGNDGVSPDTPDENLPTAQGGAG